MNENNPPPERRATTCRHGKATIACLQCRKEQPVDAHMVMAHVLFLVSNKTRWKTDGTHEMFDAYVEDGGLRFVGPSGLPVVEPRHVLVGSIRLLLKAFHERKSLHASMVPNGTFLVPVVLSAIDPAVEIPNLSQDHRLRAYVRAGWPKQRLLWLAAALDWGPTPPSLAAAKGQAWRDAHKQLYPGGSPKSQTWQLLSDSVCQRDGWRCNACGDGDTHLEVDHIQSLSRGGSSQPDNLWALCGECHLVKTRMSKRVNWLDEPKARHVRERTLQS